MGIELTPETIEGIVFGAKDITPSGFVKAGAEAQLKALQIDDKELVELMAKTSYEFEAPRQYFDWEKLQNEKDKNYYLRREKAVLSTVTTVLNARHQKETQQAVEEATRNLKGWCEQSIIDEAVERGREKIINYLKEHNLSEYLPIENSLNTLYLKQEAWQALTENKGE